MKEHTAEFRGIDWSHSIQRPGCQDHLACPSVRNGKAYPYVVPLLNASSVKQPGPAEHIKRNVTQK